MSYITKLSISSLNLKISSIYLIPHNHRSQRLRQEEINAESRAVENRKIDQLHNVIDTQESIQRQHLKDTETERQTQKVEETIDSLMKDEWNRVRIAQVIPLYLIIYSKW
jgi:hypothetical protein